MTVHVGGVFWRPGRVLVLTTPPRRPKAIARIRLIFERLKCRNFGMGFFIVPGDSYNRNHVLCLMVLCVGKVTGRAAEDVVLFTGTGTTGAVAKLVSALGLSGPLPAGHGREDR